MGFFERHFGGHVSFSLFGKRVTIYGWNAMHIAIDIQWRRQKFICFHPPAYMFGTWWPWYLYVSADATPTNAFWGIGPGFNR